MPNGQQQQRNPAFCIMFALVFCQPTVDIVAGKRVSCCSCCSASRLHSNHSSCNECQVSTKNLQTLWMIRDNSYCMGILRLTVLSSQLSLGHGQADDLHHNSRASRPAAATTAAAAAAAAESAAAAVAVAALASQGPKMIGF